MNRNARIPQIRKWGDPLLDSLASLTEFYVALFFFFSTVLLSLLLWNAGTGNSFAEMSCSC